MKPDKMVELGSKEFWKSLDENPAALAHDVCSIDIRYLDETLEKHPGLRAWVNAAHEVARVQEERAKWEVTKTRAAMLLTAKQQKDLDTGKPKTVTVLEAEVEQHPDVIAAVEHLFKQQEVRGALRAMADALEDRKDMLIQIAAKQRKEQAEYR